MAAASILQAAARVYLARRRAEGRMLAVLRIQAAFRTCLARRRAAIRRRAVLKIQAATRRQAVLKIQAVWREYRVRTNLSKEDTQDEGKCTYCKHLSCLFTSFLISMLIYMNSRRR